MCHLNDDRTVLSFAVGNNSHADNESEHDDEDDGIQKEVGSLNAQEGQINWDILK